MFVIEFGRDTSKLRWPWWRLGRFSSTVGGKPYRRVWWLGVWITWWNGDLQEYGELLKSGAVEWKT
jgi:hypothetical protein